MAVYKDTKNNTWRAVYRYTDWKGERKQTQKRGFETKREALAWEREQMNNGHKTLNTVLRYSQLLLNATVFDFSSIKSAEKSNTVAFNKS